MLEKAIFSKACKKLGRKKKKKKLAVVLFSR